MRSRSARLTRRWRVGDEVRLDAVVRDKRGQPVLRPVSWRSADASVATVTPDGELVARAEGFTRVVATLDDAQASITIPVLPARVAALQVAGPTKAVAGGGTFAVAATPVDRWGRPLANRPVLWSSSDVRVAVVTVGGTVHALRPGSVVLTASSEGVSDSVRVTVEGKAGGARSGPGRGAEAPGGSAADRASPQAEAPASGPTHRGPASAGGNRRRGLVPHAARAPDRDRRGAGGSPRGRGGGGRRFRGSGVGGDHPPPGPGAPSGGRHAAGRGGEGPRRTGRFQRRNHVVVDGSEHRPGQSQHGVGPRGAAGTNLGRGLERRRPRQRRDHRSPGGSRDSRRQLGVDRAA